MIARSLLINNIKVNDVRALISSNYGSDFSWEDNLSETLPVKQGTTTLVPLQLLISMFGFTTIWEDCLESFKVKRGKKELKIKDPFNNVSLELFTKVFGIRGEWLDDETLSLNDPLTLPYYSAFNQIHTIEEINRVFMMDLDGDGIEEMYIAYLNGSLNFAAVNSQGEWLFDQYLPGRYVYQVHPLQLDDKKGLVVITAGNGGHSAIYVFNYLLNGVTFCELEVEGSADVIDNKIIVIDRCYDTADHGTKKVYEWDEEKSSLVNTKTHIFFWNEENRVNLEEAKSVLWGFCEAIELGLAQEALSYCSPNLRVAFPENNLTYAVRHPLINLKRIIDLRQRIKKTDVLKIQQVDASEERKVFLAYYQDNPGMDGNISNGIRAVMQKSESKWMIRDINYLGDKMPTKINYSPDLKLVPVYPACSLFTCYSLQNEETKNIKVYIKSADVFQDFECLIDRCTSIELTEIFPGIQISFFRGDFRLAYFIFNFGMEVSLSGGSNLILTITCP
ncbi:MAG: hypothetical protein ACOYVD_00700 [Bacillota bacterium]